MKTDELRVCQVETVPEKLEQGVLYVSKKYKTAIHLCACGECGWKTVTPFDPVLGWTYSEDTQQRVTLRPSIGNHQFPCKSHYYITDNKIVWC